MAARMRIGLHLLPSDPFWVQVREAVYRQSQHYPLDIIPIDDERLVTPPLAEQLRMLDELVGLELQALICSQFVDALVLRLLTHQTAVISLSEIDLCHPRFTCPQGLYDAAHTIGAYLAEQLRGTGVVLLLGGSHLAAGMPQSGGESRVAGLADAFQRYPDIRVWHVPTSWHYDDAYADLCAALRAAPGPVDALVGLADPLALAGRDALQACGLLGAQTLIAGINGDPLVLAEIIAGRMAATVEVSATALGAAAVDLAYRAVGGQPLPQRFPYRQRLVIPGNAAQIAAEKLVAIADLPSRLVGVNRQHELRRLAQLETSLAINQQVGTILRRQQLSQTIVSLIQANYGFDHVRLWLRQPGGTTLELDQAVDSRAELAQGAPVRHPALDDALARGQIIFMPDVLATPAASPTDPPGLQARLVVPIRFAGMVIGLLELLSTHPLPYTRQDLEGLQLIADQLGIAMRNADLYDEAVTARALAERANQLKTRLLANVSHELRTPLHIILGYSELALATPNPYHADLPAALLHDLRQIYRSGDHLIRLINDLLDLSRAEIGALDLNLEVIDTGHFLHEVFASVATGLAEHSTTRWQLALPARLPLIEADPLRLRQVLLNLLSNAASHAAGSVVTLGAAVVPPQLQLWVEDTGPGIAPTAQASVFDPFVTAAAGGSQAGIGLGLAIARRLVLLHGGTLTLESTPGQGSTFQIRLPLPNLAGQPGQLAPGQHPWLLLIGDRPVAPVVSALCAQQGLALRQVATPAELTGALLAGPPAALAWDLAHPDLAAWELIEHVRQQPHLARLPLILFGQLHDADAPLPGGTTAVQLKPLSGASLADMIASMHPVAAHGTVLIADDEPPARAYYQQIIAQTLPGYRVVAVADGAEAIAWLEQHTPDLVILDLMMPRVDGFGVLAALRGRHDTHQVPVIVLSGHAISLEDVHRLGHATFHSKTILSADEVAEALRRALRGATLPAHTTALVTRATAYIQGHYQADLTRQQVAAVAGVSANYLSEIFQRELGITPWEFLLRYRVRQACVLLRTTDASVSAIAAQVGFNDSGYFSRVFHKMIGCAPRTYRSRPESAHETFPTPA